MSGYLLEIKLTVRDENEAVLALDCLARLVKAREVRLRYNPPEYHELVRSEPIEIEQGTAIFRSTKT